MSETAARAGAGEELAGEEVAGGEPHTRANGGATDCCAFDADPCIARHFDGEMLPHKEAGTFPPLASTSENLLDLLADVGDVRPTILELGSGSGGLSVELLRRGASRADGVDLSMGSVETARRRAEEAGVGDLATFELGDGSLVELEPHDWVVLDRVICCYEHIDRLLANAIGAARHRFVVAVPVSTGWRALITRGISFIENATNVLRGRPCPGYVHSVPMIELRLADAGFRRLRHARVGLWHTAVYERSEEPLF